MANATTTTSHHPHHPRDATASDKNSNFNVNVNTNNGVLSKRAMFEAQIAQNNSSLSSKGDLFQMVGPSSPTNRAPRRGSLSSMTNHDDQSSSNSAISKVPPQRVVLRRGSSTSSNSSWNSATSWASPTPKAKESFLSSSKTIRDANPTTKASGSPTSIGFSPTTTTTLAQSRVISPLIGSPRRTSTGSLFAVGSSPSRRQPCKPRSTSLLVTQQDLTILEDETVRAAAPILLESPTRLSRKIQQTVQQLFPNLAGTAADGGDAGNMPLIQLVDDDDDDDDDDCSVCSVASTASRRRSSVKIQSTIQQIQAQQQAWSTRNKTSSPNNNNKNNNSPSNNTQTTKASKHWSQVVQDALDLYENWSAADNNKKNNQIKLTTCHDNSSSSKRAVARRHSLTGTVPTVTNVEQSPQQLASSGSLPSSEEALQCLSSSEQATVAPLLQAYQHCRSLQRQDGQNIDIDTKTNHQKSNRRQALNVQKALLQGLQKKVMALVQECAASAQQDKDMNDGSSTSMPTKKHNIHLERQYKKKLLLERMQREIERAKLELLQQEEESFITKDIADAAEEYEKAHTHSSTGSRNRTNARRFPRRSSIARSQYVVLDVPNDYCSTMRAVHQQQQQQQQDSWSENDDEEPMEMQDGSIFVSPKAEDSEHNETRFGNRVKQFPQATKTTITAPLSPRTRNKNLARQFQKQMMMERLQREIDRAKRAAHQAMGYHHPSQDDEDDIHDDAAGANGRRVARRGSITRCQNVIMDVPTDYWNNSPHWAEERDHCEQQQEGMMIVQEDFSQMQVNRAGSPNSSSRQAQFPGTVETPLQQQHQKAESQLGPRILSPRPSQERGNSMDQDGNWAGEDQDEAVVPSLPTREEPTQQRTQRRVSTMRPGMVRGNSVDNEGDWTSEEDTIGMSDEQPKRTQRRVSAMRPGMMRGNSVDKEGDWTSEEDTIGMSDEQPKRAQRRVSSMRPGMMRGNSVDKQGDWTSEEDTIGMSDEQPKNAQRRVSTMRPGMVRGNSVDKEGDWTSEEDRNLPTQQERPKRAQRRVSALRPGMVRGLSVDGDGDWTTDDDDLRRVDQK